MAGKPALDDTVMPEDMLAMQAAVSTPEAVAQAAAKLAATPVPEYVPEADMARPAPMGIAGAQGGTMVPSSLPGVYVDQSQFVVLASRLGRLMEPLPKRNPQDDNEETKYAVPEAFERGEVITLKDIWQDPLGKIDNVARLLRTGAIGRLDHPDALGAIKGLQYRREQEAQVLADRGIIAR